MALLCSLSLHVGAYVAYQWVAAPRFDFDLELETDLELGLAEPVPVEPWSGVPGSEAPPIPGSAELATDNFTGRPDPGWGLEPDASPPPEPDAAPKPEPDAGAAEKKAPDAAPKPEPDAAPTPKPDAAPKSEPDAAPKPEPDAAPNLAAARPDAAPPSAGPDAGVVAQGDAGRPDAALAAASGAPTDGGAAAGDATRGPVGLAAQPPSGTIALPAGAQIALRLDLALVRTTPLAEDARALLAAIPDWQRLLDGSGVDPATALDRLLIATPSLRQDKMVLAGAVANGDLTLVRQAVAALARARGIDASWNAVDGYPVAVWANADTVKRYIALLSDRHFIIARPADVPTVLALAAAREAERLAAAGGPDAGPRLAGSEPGPRLAGSEPGPRLAGSDPDPGPRLVGPDALLWMAPDTVVSGEVDGARRLIRGQPPLAPERLRVAIVALTGERAGLEAEAAYLTRPEAEAAALTLENVRRSLLGDPATGIPLRVMGLASSIEAATIEIREETKVYLHTELTYGQIRAVLGALRASLEARAAQAAAAASAPPSAPVSAAPTSMRRGVPTSAAPKGPRASPSSAPPASLPSKPVRRKPR